MHPHRCDQEGALDPATFNYAMRKQIIHYSQCLLAHRMQVMMSHHHTQCHIIIHSCLLAHRMQVMTSCLMKIVENEKCKHKYVQSLDRC
jgi:hypothetical protein